MKNLLGEGGGAVFFFFFFFFLSLFCCFVLDEEGQLLINFIILFINVLHISVLLCCRESREEYLKGLAREDTQLLLNKLWEVWPPSSTPLT